MNTKSSNFVKKWTKFQTKAQKYSKVHFIREIWCSNRETGRCHEKLGRLPGKPGELAGMSLSQFNTNQKLHVRSTLFTHLLFVFVFFLFVTAGTLF